MKKTIFVTLFVLGLLVFSTTAFAHTEDDPFVVDLLAGQDMDIGDVLVWNDADNLYVRFKSDVCMLETHLHIATSVEGIPQTKKFNPIPGQFDYSTFHGCSKDFTYEIPRTWAYGDELFIAAHASLGQEMSMMIYSDGELNTMVTAGNVVDAVYPYPAVDAWEYSGDPVDTTPSAWDNALTYEGWSMADWVWENYRTVDPIVTQYVTFQHDFTVPGYPLSGVLHIATDNTYSASLNGVFVGEQTDYNLWSQVGEYDFMPVEGSNTFQVIGSNFGNSSYNINNNPAGLIYEAEITYLESDESAWGDGLDFAGKNWATYFSYTVQKPPLVIGSWDTVRGDLSAFATTDAFATARQAIVDEYSATYDISYQTFNVLSSSLNDVDVVILGSVKQNESNNPISALSANEQIALYEYVDQGGCAILLTDGTSFNPGNDSLTSPFGLTTAGGFSGQPLATISAGFTSVPTYKPNYPGYYAGAGSYTAIANFAGGQVAGVMGSVGSGKFFAFSDINMFWNVAYDIGGAFFTDNAQFFLDVLDACSAD
jgi:hypothetical protein